MAKPAFKSDCGTYCDTLEEATAVEAIDHHCLAIAVEWEGGEHCDPLREHVRGYILSNHTELHALLGMLAGSKAVEELANIRRAALRALAPIEPEQTKGKTTPELVQEAFAALSPDGVELDRIRDLCLEHANLEASDDDTLELVRNALAAADVALQEARDNAKELSHNLDKMYGEQSRLSQAVGAVHTLTFPYLLERVTEIRAERDSLRAQRHEWAAGHSQLAEVRRERDRLQEDNARLTRLTERLKASWHEEG